MDSEAALREQLCSVVSGIHGRGWALGTGGNFSVLLSKDPLRLIMTPSSVDKGEVLPGDLVLVDETGEIAPFDDAQGWQEQLRRPLPQPPPLHFAQGRGNSVKASAEALLHVALVEERGAGAVLHTHSAANTLLGLDREEVVLSGYEMLKALSGVRTHVHTERVPVLPNSQDMKVLSSELRVVLRARPDMHAFILRGHGLYTWGDSLFDAKRHLEALEFLFEVEVRRG